MPRRRAARAMADGYEHVSLPDLDPHPDKPGRRWELSPRFGVEGCNVNVAVLDPGERLSQSHYHYHEHQRELLYVAAGRCRVEVPDGRVDLETDDVLALEAGPGGAHVAYNHTEAPCKLVALGWPQDERYPVVKVETLDALLADREDG